ncbi:hypothetical protein Cob_v009672 [Colletotrichum orbiculare MAFF 240422]|uniref:Uncharacterized protein n=1 Tax=Colletotrichum orbiculare (strain 104-T / ATCC 96160 / CBS 514.97 / LARS 414 / MAFF 240422) TaxID=1213857 RepID=N4VGJ4_COLOR|nr:hypothetical protein Cob_v009672 [Colletotrichum orbiculare MAFF 240422]
MKLITTLVAVLVSLAVAAPTRQEKEPVLFGIMFIFDNGTFTDIFDVPETLSGYPIASHAVVINVFINPPQA